MVGVSYFKFILNLYMILEDWIHDFKLINICIMFL